MTRSQHRISTLVPQTSFRWDAIVGVEKCEQCSRANKAFSLTWAASVQFYWSKRKHLHEKRVQLPQDWFVTPTFPLFIVLEHQYGRRDVMWKRSILYHCFFVLLPHLESFKISTKRTVQHVKSMRLPEVGHTYNDLMRLPTNFNCSKIFWETVTSRNSSIIQRKQNHFGWRAFTWPIHAAV